MKINSARGRTAAAVVASVALVGTGATLVTAPAQSAPPADDCAEPFPVADLVDGDTVHGLTVSEGTTPDPFTGEILGVMPNGIAPGLPMILAELDSPALTEVGGIWSGMSGSPVYADSDNRLIGAVAYTLTWGTTPVAGITPFEDMDDYLGTAAPATIPVTKKQAKAIAADSEVSRAQAEQGFRQLPMPTGVSGITAARLTKARRKGPDYLELRGVRAMSSLSGAAAAGPETLEAGGNLGAAYSYGEITAGGVGTVTSVCDGELVGFGHPMDFLGKTQAGMMPAEALFVQRDSLGSPFKVANMGMPAGTIDEDRLTGISGVVDVLPDETDITSTVSYGTRGRTGTSHSLSPDFNADIAFYQLLGNHDRIIDSIQPGSSTATLTITGTDADDEPFEVEFSDRYTSRWDIAWESTFDTADLTWALSRMRGVTVDSVDSDSKVTDTTGTWRVAGVQQRRGGGWSDLTRRSPAFARAGKLLRLRAVLVRGSRTERVPLAVSVPRNSKRRAFLQVVGGASDWGTPGGGAKTPQQLTAALARSARNDQVTATLTIPQRGEDRVRRDVSAQQSHVVRGGKWFEVFVG